MYDTTHADASEETCDEQSPVLLFDGVCNLCNDYVQFVFRRDDAERIRFGSLQSAESADLLERCGLPRDYTDSLVVVEGTRYYTGSTAVLRVCHHLGGKYRLATALSVVPERIRDWLYGFIAARRYDWFGKREQCMVPSSDIRSRFIDSAPRDDDGG